MLKFDEFGALAERRLTPADLIGRRVKTNYRALGERVYTTGTIEEHLGGMRFGVRLDNYHVVDMHRSEFALPRKGR